MMALKKMQKRSLTVTNANGTDTVIKSDYMSEDQSTNNTTATNQSGTGSSGSAIGGSSSGCFINSLAIYP